MAIVRVVVVLTLLAQCAAITKWAVGEALITPSKFASADAIDPLFGTPRVTPGIGMVSSIHRIPLPAIRVDSMGGLLRLQVIKKRLSSDLGLPLRDLRIIDPTYPKQIQAAFVIRPSAVLCSLENIKILVRHNEVLVFNPNAEDSQKLVASLRVQLAAARPLFVHPVNLFNYQKTLQRRSPILIEAPTRLCFEHVVLETALHLAFTTLSAKARDLQPLVGMALKNLRAESHGLDVIKTQVDELLPLKNQLDDLHKRVVEVKRAISSVLQSDVDMNMIFLSECQHEKRSREEDGVGTADVTALEMLLENYLHEAEWLEAEVEEILDEVTNNEENVVLHLDLIRNRILRFELGLSIASLLVSSGALITGLFGMNLLSHLESHRYAFYVVSSLMIVSAVIGCKEILSFAQREKLM